MEKINKFIDGSINMLFSKDRTKLYVLILFILGFIFRLINALNAPTSVDASGHAIMAINFVSSEKLATWNQSVGLWHYLTDLAYRLFGINDFSARIVALIFGSFSIILIFLFVKEFFGKRAGLIAAFLLAFSPFHIAETIPEMDVAAMFFILFSMLFFVRALKSSRKKMYFYSGIFIGIAILIKIYALLYIPAMIIYAAFYSRKHSLNKKEISKNILLFLVISLIFFLVPITYNYLLYQDKGIMDYLFTSSLGYGKEKSAQYYSWVVPYRHEYKNFFFGGKSSLTSSSLPLFLYPLRIIFNVDPINLIFGILGMLILLRKEKKDYLFLLLGIFATIYIYLGSLAFMSKHYMFVLFMLIPLSSLFVERISKKINLKIIITIILIFQLFWLYSFTGGHFLHKSAMNQMISFKSSQIPENSLVVYDGRIFRGIGAFMFSGTNYIESSLFGELVQMQEKLPGNYQSIEVYFIECVPDDCGWGTIKDQPDFNKSTEEIVDFFKNKSAIKKTIFESKLKNFYSSPIYEEEYKVYKTNLNMKISSFQAAASTHVFWGNPIGYDERITPAFDKYETHSSFQAFLNILAHWIMYFSAFASLASLLILAYLFSREDGNTA